MSFSQSVKEELCSVITDRDKEYACLYGMLLFCRRFSAEEIQFQTENRLAADMFSRLSDKIIGRSGTVAINETKKKNGSSLYSLTVPAEPDREELIFRFRISSSKLIHRIQEDIIDNNNVFAFLAGAFISCGSVTEPIKEYHLEFAVPFEELCTDLKKLLERLGIMSKYVERKGLYVLYFKGSEDIEDMLTLMGATKSSIELMNVKILKDVRNKANRIANCDAANIERTLKASEKQIEDIEYIMNTEGFESLTPELRNMAELRLENPDVSLKELGEMLDKPVGRSGANHRLKKLMETRYVRTGAGQERNNMKKAAKTVLVIIAALPIIICALQLIGAAVNIADGHIRADRAKRYIVDMGGKICGSCVYTGNTSGTGNHTENQLLFVVRTNGPRGIEKELSNVGSASVYPASEAEEHFYMFDITEKMDIPAEDGYYIAEIICPAPFGDNIMGH